MKSVASHLYGEGINRQSLRAVRLKHLKKIFGVYKREQSAYAQPNLTDIYTYKQKCSQCQKIRRS